MSGQAAAVPTFGAVRMPSHPSRPPLRVVGPDERARPGAPVGAALSSIRLTARGRGVIALVGCVVAVALTVLLASSVDAAAPQIDHITRVLAGQTLSEVALAQLPTLPVPDAVARIQLVNGMSTPQVQAGQTLLIPSMH